MSLSSRIYPSARQTGRLAGQWPLTRLTGRLLKATTALAIAVSFYHCPLAPIDPGALSDLDSGLFSLPAEITDGYMAVRLGKFTTKGTIGVNAGDSNQIASIDDDVYDPEDDVIMGAVGAQVMYRYTREAFTDKGVGVYLPRFVVSGAQRAEDIAARKNVLIVSLLSGKLRELGFPDRNKVTPEIRDIMQTVYCTLPTGYTDSGFNPNAGGAAISIQYPKCDDSVFWNGGNAAAAREFTSTGRELWATGGFTTNQADANKFNLVIEYIDNTRTIFTTIFPYNSENLSEIFVGNHTNSRVKVINFPSIDPDDDDGYSNTELDNLLGTRISSFDPEGLNPDLIDSLNCTGFYSDPTQGDLTSYDPLNFLYALGKCNDLYDLMTDPALITAFGQQSQERNSETHCERRTTSDGKKDLVCMHLMQEAGREVKAEGTDGDPLFEFAVFGLEFNVVRARDRYLSE